MKFFKCVLLSLLGTVLVAPGRAQLPEGVVVRKIGDRAEHSAFTDLIRFKNRFYCTFREGSGHVPGTDGAVRILTSGDGKQWEDLALLTKPGIDLRDPKLSVTPDGRLMIIIGGSIYRNGKLEGRVPHVSFSDKKGEKFSEPEKVTVDPAIVSWGDWLWRVTWHKGTGYTIDYQVGPQERRGPTAMYLLKTRDGKKFEKVSKLELDGFPNEATIRFDAQDVMHVLIRRELGDQMGVWAVSRAPFTEWEYKKLGIRLGGPNFIFTGEGRKIVGTRVYEPEAETAILTEDRHGKLRELLRLPSAKDNSYPGMLIHNGMLYVSYYSTHEGKTAVYFVEIPLSLVAEKEKAPGMKSSSLIWDKPPHSAFTDLIRYKEKWWCTFREGTGHVPGSGKENGNTDGTIRVLASVDGKKWESQALIAEPGIDLRDPKLAVMPDGRLMISCGGSVYKGSDLMEWHTRVIFSPDGVNWSTPARVKGIPANNWFFRLTWNGDTGYAAANVCGAYPESGRVNTKKRQLILYKTTDGLNFEQVSADFNPSPEGCEATVRFREEGRMVVVVRNAGGKSDSGFLLFSEAPYTLFRKVRIDHGMGGQNLMHLKDDDWLVVTREYEDERPDSRSGVATVLLQVNEKGAFRRLFELPSGGDTGYPGLAVHEDRLWISYYSSHGQKTAIYLSTIPMDELQRR